MPVSGDESARGAGPIEAETRRRIERAIARARLVLIWESVWPILAPILVLAGLFAIVSWFGLWRVVSDPVRFVILAAFAAAAIFLAIRAFRLRRPARAAALARVEMATGALHRPATAFTDRLAVGAADPAAEALWMAHRERLLASLDNLKAGLPSPGLTRSDPVAIRFLAILLFVVAFFFAGPERGDKLAEAFRGGEPVATTIARIDAWVTPPAYTSRAPIFLTGEAAKPSGSEYSVPIGSIVTVRTGGANDLAVVSGDENGETPAGIVTPKDGAAIPAAGQPVERQVELRKPAEVVVRKGERDVMAWKFTVEADHAPEIAFVKPPAPTRSGALALNYSLKDDYGVVAGNAEVEPLDDHASDTAARPLIEAPSIPLSLPQLRTRDGAAETIRDLTSHPWAGATVRMTLVARDEAGQEGRSAPVEVTLPARRFTNPLARAVVEQRAKLAMDANAADRVADAIDALTLAPEDTFDNIGNYLALRSAYYQLLNARGDDDLRGVVDYLWSIALGIEDGDLSLAAQALRDAQEALRQALENGTSDEEIAKLTEQLRQAMQEFLQALAQEAQRNPMASLPPDANIQTIRPQDLERMLDQIENLAKNGARDAARQLLSELQNMMENLQAGRPMQGDQQAGSEMMQSLNELGDMIRRQQQLMDQTYKAQRGMQQDGQPMSPEDLANALKQLQEGQQGLARALQELMDKMQGQGMQPNGKLGQAGDAMGRAAESLGQGDAGQAVGDQGSALEALRQGAQGMAQQLANQGPGYGGTAGGHQMPNQDPLGRPQRTLGPDLGTTVKVPDEIDIQRAREILDAIRKRLGDPGRSLIERDYLERLLDRF